jgi:penicillin-binding protein 1A
VNPTSVTETGNAPRVARPPKDDQRPKTVIGELKSPPEPTRTSQATPLPLPQPKLQKPARKKAPQKPPKRAKKQQSAKAVRKRKSVKKPRKTGRRLAILAATAGLALCLAMVPVYLLYRHITHDLPTNEALRTYQPPTVTEVYDYKGALLGEIYEQRRYVLPLEEIPEVVQNAFIATEDADFWNHGGVDYVGLTRAVLNELKGGQKSQGASTITMQVTRNFLLTRAKTYERKLKEIILARRMEQTYEKRHILFLYLNELYLGSGAYGVEAAARTYFGKNVADVTLAEAALIAGLAPAPTTYSPHKNWAKARTRQEYVLSRMLETSHITKEQYEQAIAEKVKIVKEDNPFLKAAPHFTEHVRRFLVTKYGHNRVYNEGLKVRTTCDLALQKKAQESITKAVHVADQRVGFRRNDLVTLKTNSEISERRAAQEKEMLAAFQLKRDPAHGRVAPPKISETEEGVVYEAVVLEVKEKWAKIGIGAHDGLIPLTLARWAYDPNPKRSWKGRRQSTLLERVDGDDDGKRDGSIMRAGDIIEVKVRAKSTKNLPKDMKKYVSGTPGEKEDLVLAALWQTPEVEGALLSYQVETGAVRAMVGGADYTRSEFNRATQSVRQVGSTFKPIVYASAIDTERVTAATMVTDAPLAYATTNDFIWKPSNYGRDYLGNITLRKALALSRNTCTIKVLELIDPGMNKEIVYNFARALGIGGLPTHQLPEDWIPSPKNDHLCPWIREEPQFTICTDRLPPKDPNISNTKHRQLMGPNDVYMCRACDMSMALGTSSLTMEELLRAYSTFASGGALIEPYYIEQVLDRDDNVLESHQPKKFAQVITPEVASITTWLLQGVATGGTGARAYNELRVPVAGKTGTTDDHKDTWFVGFTSSLITGTWIGYDKPRSLGAGHTGGKTALPPWIAYMKEAKKTYAAKSFPMRGNIEWANIDEEKGIHVTSGGRAFPFITGTVPESSGVAAGQVTAEDLTEL